MSEEVSLLLVAIGGYGANYIEEIEKRPELPVKIEGICEIMEGMEERFPIIKEKRIPIYQNIETFFREHHAKLAILSTPIHLHYEQIRTCLLAGSNVLTEKPVCTTVEGANRLMELERETGLFVSVGYQLNYSKDVLAMKQDIQNGVYGSPVLMKGLHAMRRGKSYYERNNWAGRIKVHDCGVNDSPFNNACAHQFQNMTFLLGNRMDTAADLVSIEANPYRGNPSVENYDILAVRATTEAGVPIYYYTAHPLRDKKIGPFTEFRFEHGTIYFGRDADGTPIDEYIGRLDNSEVIHYGQVAKGERLQKLDDALECVRNGGHPVCTIQAAIPHLRAVEKIAQLPILPIAEEQREYVEEGNDSFCHIRNLKDMFEECYEQHKLPGELGLL